MGHPTEALVLAQQAKEEPDIDEICDFISNGSTLAKYCAINSLHYGRTRHWIKANDYRKTKLDDSVALRDEWATEHMCSMVLDIARFDHSRIVDQEGQILPIDQWPPEARAAVANLEVVPGTNMIKVKFIDRLKAVELVAKLRGMFVTNVNVTTEKSLAELVTASMKEEK